MFLPKVGSNRASVLKYGLGRDLGHDSRYVSLYFYNINMHNSRNYSSDRGYISMHGSTHSLVLNNVGP